VKEADGKPGTYYDRFRARLIFPIRDIAGRIVAFTGRALKAEEPAKYLNSPETEIYHKSEILFGMDRAKDAIRTRGFAILVEGQLDLLHAHQAGFTNTVALSGTALTERHLSLMKRYSENLMLALDADSAGLAATWKSALLALGAGMKVKAIALPRGKDPADLISEDAKEFAKRVAEAKPVPEFFLAALSEREKDAHRLVLSVERIVLPIIAATPSPIERDHFVGLVARALGLSSEAVALSVKRSASAVAGESLAGKAQASQPMPTLARARMLQAAAQCYPDTPLAERIKTEYARIVGAPLPAEEIPEGELFLSGVAFGEAPEEGAADDLLAAFEETVIREAYQEAVGKLRRAEAMGDPALVEAAQAECGTLAKKLAALST
jgi:DNA primase